MWNEQAGHPAAKHSERLRQERRVFLASPPSEAALTAAVSGRQHMWKMWKVTSIQTVTKTINFDFERVLWLSGSFKVRMMMRNNKIPAEIPFLKVTSVIFGDKGFEKAVYMC